MRNKYKRGDVVELSVDIHDPYRKDLVSGTLGHVTCVDDIGQIHVNWTCHSSLAVMDNECRLVNAKDLWLEFGDVPMDPDTECLEVKWRHFPAGTNREEIWHWFEYYFNLSVAEDLML